MPQAPDPATPGLLDLLAEPPAAPSPAATTEPDALTQPLADAPERRSRDWSAPDGAVPAQGGQVASDAGSYTVRSIAVPGGRFTPGFGAWSMTIESGAAE